MIGRTVGHYRILERLGAGGMGVVYKAEDLTLGRFVALKFLPPELTRDNEAKSRFLREARAASLLDHPNICTIHDIGDTEDEQTYIAMACYEGETLKSRIERGPMAIDEALKIAEQIAQGLGKAHESGIVHRDIKSANVIVTRDGVVKILDFGLAKLAGATDITRTNKILGTLSYMAPEQLRGETVGPQADLWSLGVVLFEMVTGRLPFGGGQGAAYSILSEQPAALAELRPDAPADLDRIVRKMLRKDPRQRYQNANEVLAELGMLGAPSPAPDTLAPTEVRPGTTESRAMIGRTVGHYRIAKRLGGGGMGVVYKAEDLTLDRAVALKFLPPELTRDHDAKQRFLIEARAAAKLDHPNICSVYDVAESDDGQTFIAMAYYEGESLAKRIERGPIPIDEAAKIAVEVARGLGKAHQAGIIHRDIKPANVMLTSEGGVKIVDFGVAKLAGVTMTHAGGSPGTLAYMAPEQICGEPVTPATDLWALGAVFYEMLTGSRPFRGEQEQAVAYTILNEPPAPLDQTLPKRPPVLDSVIAKALTKDAKQRYQTAEELIDGLKTVTDGRASTVRQAASRMSARQIGLVAAMVVVAAAMLVVGLVQGSLLVRHRREVAWARNTALPRLMQFIDREEHWEAFALAHRIETVIPGEPQLEGLWSQFTGEIGWRTSPPGAEVFVKPSSEPHTEWIRLGPADGSALRTPIGCMVYRLDRPGHESAYFRLALTYGQGVIRLTLQTPEEREIGMARIEPPDFDTLRASPDFYYDVGPLEKDVGRFLIDTHEVTNREYKQFVDDGGYRRPEFWKHGIVEGGKVIAWSDAVGRFVDTTGRPGPINWELGSWPDGTADHPVTGVSWFEAAAYAEWAGKLLPTVHHWWAASGAQNGGCSVSSSNFSGTLTPVGSNLSSVNLRGLYDMAGNAREWCSTGIGTRRVTMGGACDGPEYKFFERDSQEPIERNPTTGFRCMRLIEPAVLSDNVAAAISHLDEGGAISKDWRNVAPFSDEVWATWLRMISYTPAKLDARVESIENSHPYWRMEKVSFTAAYHGERMLAYIFIPRGVAPPYQTVVFWPGGLVTRLTSSDEGRGLSDSKYWAYLVRDGRALLYPILTGTYERGGGGPSPTPPETWVMQAKDLRRSVDYLESRDDIDMERLAFFGFSMGAHRGTLACAGEQRFRAAILQSGGARYEELLGCAHRIRIPVQMVNGRYDTNFPYETSQVPMFQALATPSEHKRAIVLETDHGLAGADKEVMKVNLEWLDRYLGPVERGGGGEAAAP